MQFIAAYKGSSENTRYLAFDNNTLDKSESRIKSNEESKNSNSSLYLKDKTEVNHAFFERPT